MKEISKFYKSLVQEVVTRQIANEEGDNQEQAFTRICLELLSEAGETENTDVAFYERDLGTPNQQKVNGYAIADNYETVDLFLSIYEGTEESVTILKRDIENASKRLINFFRNLNSKMERSQSCSDTGQDRAKSRLRAAPTSKAKVNLRLRLLGFPSLI